MEPLARRTGGLLLALALGACRGTPVEDLARETPVTAPRPAAPAPKTAPTPPSAEAPAPEDERAATAPARAMVLPRLAKGSAPVYPEISQKLGEEGTVELRLEIRSDGEVLKIEVSRSSGYRRLDQAALEAARTWRFNPRTGAYGVEELRHRLVFRLEEVR